MKLVLLRIIFLVTICIADDKIYAQQYTTVNLEYKKDNLLKDSFFFHVMKPFQSESYGESFLYNDKIISYTEKDSVCRIISQFEVPDTTCAFLCELMGHEIVVIPGDTINLKVYPKGIILKTITAFPSRNPGLYSISYSGYTLLKEISSNHVREHVLTNFLSKYAYNQPRPFDSLFNDYTLTCTDQNYVFELSQNVKKNRVRLSKERSLTIEDALDTKVMGPDKRIIILKTTFLPNKPTIIDCWATWCGPCMRELPEEMSFQRRYGKSINFINLSSDRNAKKWEAGPAKLLSKKNYFLPNAFRSDFATFSK